MRHDLAAMASFLQVWEAAQPKLQQAYEVTAAAKEWPPWLHRAVAMMRAYCRLASTSYDADFLQKAQEVAELILRNAGSLIEREGLN